MKRLLLAAVAVLAWTGIAAYGAIQGWWLHPIAPRGDTHAFMQAASALAQDQSKGNFALVLLRQGRVDAEQYKPSIDPVDRDTRFPLASMSKWFTAYAVMQQVQAGRLDLDAPVSTYLKQWQLPAGTFDQKQVTIGRLLSHTAGLTDGLGFGDYLPSESLPSLQETLRHPRASSDSTVTIAVGRAPGSGFQYSGGGYLILQALLEDVTGMPFATWMQDSVLGPLGMQRATYAYLAPLDNVSRSFDARGAIVPTYRYAAAGATGLSASARDLVAFAQAQLRTDDGAGALLLHRAALEGMRQPHGRKLGLDIWGLGVALYAPTASGAYVYGHDGANAPAINTSMRINPDNGDAVIVLVTGHPSLATTIGSEWTLWQTGVVDFLSVDRALRSAFVPWLLGLAVIAALWGWRVVRRRSATYFVA
ncbi:MAG: beta-lactamase family protein [Gemmatimonadetes bacterium]|nr:beta-lactamase family protein [Gemmatimonadota bacterium]